MLAALRGWMLCERDHLKWIFYVMCCVDINLFVGKFSPF